MPQTFTKEERLCSFKEITALVTHGKSLFHYPFKVIYTENSNADGNKILVSVSKKLFKKAVVRNLLKRRIRESYRKNKDRLEVPAGTSIHLMFIYISKDILDYPYIESKIKDILGNLSKVVAESS